MSGPDQGGGPPEVVAVTDASAAAEAAARALAAAVGRARERTGGPVSIALSGGTTPIVAYERLGPLVEDWASVTVFLADERCVAYADPDSNARLVDEALGADRGYVLHRLPAIGSPGDRARAYAHELGDRPLDVVLLGLGEDGHTASLFPRHGALEASGTTVAVLDSPKPPPERVSLTLPALQGAHELVLLVTGGGKAAALRQTLGDPGIHAPASLLPRDRLLVIADDAALVDARDAGLLPA